MKPILKVSDWSFPSTALVFAFGLITLTGVKTQAQNLTVSGHLQVTGDTSLSGALNVTGTAELNSNITNFGTNGANAATPGLVLTYTDTVSGTVSTITLATSGTTAIWQWVRNSANGLIPQMTLTGTNSIVLWNPTVSNSAGIVLNPAGDSTFSGSITSIGSNSRLPNQQITTDTASVLTKGYADNTYLMPTGNGSSLTGLNASNITIGILGDARLSPNVGLLNGSQTYTGSNTYAGTQVFNGGLNSTTLSASSVSVSGSLSVTTISATSAIGLPKNTQYGLAANYNASLGDVYGIEQVTNGQAGSPRAATRVFTSGYGPAIPEIAFGKYTGTNSFTTFGVFTYTGSFIVGSGSDTLGNGQAGDIVATGNLKLETAGTGVQIKEGGASNRWTLRGSTNSTALTVDYNGAQTPLSINTNSATIAGNLTVTTLSGSGGNITGLNATSITSGALADARLSSNVGLLNGSQIYSGNNTHTGTETFSGVLTSTTFSTQNATVSGVLTGTTISATSAIGLPKNTQYGLAANYNASLGDVYGIEQVTNGQAGSPRAATRVFTSGYGPAIPEIAFGKYTGTNSFTTFGVFTYTGSFIVGSGSDTLGNGQAGDIVATGNLKLETAGSGVQIKEGGTSNRWTLRGSTNSTALTVDYNGAQTPLSINTNSVSISGALNVVGTSTLSNTHVSPQGDLSMGEFTAQ